MSKHGIRIGAFLLVAIAASRAGATGSAGLDATQRDSSEWPEVAACYPDLPAPQIVITGMRQRPPWIDYYFMIANWADYPADLFAPAPHLPPCGYNESASRTWIEIYVGGTGNGGYCNLSRSYLRGLQLGVSVLNCPDAVEVSFYDRECGIVYRSGPVSLLCPTAVAPVSWSTIKVLFR